ncbi:ferredoxin [Mycobacterium sp. LTG2003]
MANDNSDRHVRVDAALCEGHALCIDLAPDVFDLGDDEVASAKQVTPEQWERVRAAVDACPRQAITFQLSPRKANEQ